MIIFILFFTQHLPLSLSVFNIYNGEDWLATQKNGKGKYRVEERGGWEGLNRERQKERKKKLQKRKLSSIFVKGWTEKRDFETSICLCIWCAEVCYCVRLSY